MQNITSAAAGHGHGSQRPVQHSSRSWLGCDVIVLHTDVKYNPTLCMRTSSLYPATKSFTVSITAGHNWASQLDACADPVWAGAYTSRLSAQCNVTCAFLSLLAGSSSYGCCWLCCCSFSCLDCCTFLPADSSASREHQTSGKERKQNVLTPEIPSD